MSTPLTQLAAPYAQTPDLAELIRVIQESTDLIAAESLPSADKYDVVADQGSNTPFTFAKADNGYLQKPRLWSTSI